MKGSLLKKITQFLREHQFNKRWQKVVTVMAVIVVFCTTYMLILPALTMEAEPICGMQEHQHSEECYTQTYIKESIKCESEIHKHEADCYGDDGLTACGYADFVVHTHSDICYEGETLICTLSEVEAHTHTQEECFDEEGGFLICEKPEIQLHEHTEECYEKADEAVTEENTEATEATEEERLICGMMEVVEHTHTEECFTVVAAPKETTCETEEHTHTEECFEKKDADVQGGSSAEEEKDTSEETADAEKEIVSSQLAVFSSNLLGSSKATTNYVSDLSNDIVSVRIEDKDGTEISDGATIYIGEEYNVYLEFKEKNTGSVWEQFAYDEDGYLTYEIPDNLKCHPFDNWHIIDAETDNGTLESVGEYFVDANGHLKVKFYDVTDEYGNKINFIDKYSNVDFWIAFEAAIAVNSSGSSTTVDFGNQIEVDLNIDGSAGMTVTKSHGSYDSDNHTMEYTIRVEATKGVVKDLVIDDQIWDSHYTLRDTIVVTDLEGNVIDPQPTVSDHPSHNSGAEEGFRISGFPDFSAGNGFLITYKTQIYDYLLSNDTVDLWNGLDSTGKDSNGSDVYVWAHDWLSVELEKMEKDGKQSVLEDADGNPVPVIEWEVEIKKDNHNLQGTVIIDTLGTGLEYYTEKDIRVKCYDEWGNRLDDVYISWDDVTVNGNTMSFALPDGYAFDIVYYSRYEELAEGEKKNYTNTVSAVINGKEETAGGDADVIGFIPNVRKSASGNDGEYAYFTIEADVPAVIKDWGNFFLTDLAAFWGYNNDEGYLYVENIPEDMVITAVTESGATVNFTPYVEGGPTENTFILIAPAEGNQHHSFNVLFNTSEATFESSKWILDEDSVLTITYKLPFDSKTGTEWDSELSGDKTLGDVLLDGYSVSNEAYLNYTDVIRGIGATTYEYSPIITKDSVVNDDGTIDYTVVFHNTIPGSHGDSGYITASTNMMYFNDTFDEKLEYVEDSFVVTGYDPWRDGLWMNKYKYEGTVEGNTISIPADEFVYVESNPDATAVGWGGLPNLTDLQKFYKYVNAGGDYVFTYKLKLKDEYLYTIEHSKFELDNSAEITWDNNGTSGPVDEKAEYETGLVEKHVVQREDKLDFDIHINEMGLDLLENNETITVDDTMSKNISVYWNTIKLLYEDEDGNWIDFDSADSDYTYTITYDPDENKLSFVLPDSLHIRIDYTTLITESGKVSVANLVKIEGKAEVSDFINSEFQVDKHSGGASGSLHSVTLLKQDALTDEPLPDVTFLLYGPMGSGEALPSGAASSVVSDNGIPLYYIGSYTTGADGTVEIETQFLNTDEVYALVEAVAPEGYDLLDSPVCFYYYGDDPGGLIQSVTTIVTVKNYAGGYILPATGGNGGAYYYIFGGAFVTLSLLALFGRGKKRRTKEAP